MEEKYLVNVTESAVNDMNSVMSYFSRVGNNDFGIIFQNELDKKVDDMSYFPKMYVHIFSQDGLDYRRMIIRKYIVLYYLDDKKESVLISRIFHQREDYQNMNE